MASLTEVYENGNGAGLRRLYAGVTTFGVGVILLVAGIVVATTSFGQWLGLGFFEARKVAGIFGGLGLPALLIGTMTVLPRASWRIRSAAIAGGIVCLGGIAAFANAYPVDWVGGSGNASMTLVVAITYFGGALVATWSLFAAIANFKARNDSGGTVSIEITRGGKTRIVEVQGDSLRQTLGGIGLLGGTPDGEVETQTNVPSSPTTSSMSSTPTTSASAVSDGGGTTDDAVFLDEDETPITDTYCGNCDHFRYARTDDGLVPYCGLDETTMADMDACDQWTPT